MGFVRAAPEADFYNGIFHPVLFQLFNRKALEQIFFAQKVGFQRGKQKAFSESAGTAQKIGLSFGGKLVDKMSFIYINSTAIA